MRMIERAFKRGCSIIIPTWNCEATIQRCLDSILKAFPKSVPLEILIIDKGSTDNTTEIIGDWAFKNFDETKELYSKIPVRIYIESGALGAARLMGIKRAKYPTVFWLDADIVLPENYIEDLFKKLHDYSYDHDNAVAQIQGRMRGTSELMRKWWEGYGIAVRRKQKSDAVEATNGPTANALVLKSALLMTHEEEEQLKKMHSCEDGFISKAIQRKGYVQLLFPVDTIHLIEEVLQLEGEHKMVWSLVGLKDQGYGKIMSLWKMKWIWRNGFFAFLEYRTFDLVAHTVAVQLNLIRACIKDKRIIEQRRLVTLKEW